MSDQLIPPKRPRGRPRKTPIEAAQNSAIRAELLVAENLAKAKTEAPAITVSAETVMPAHLQTKEWAVQDEAPQPNSVIQIKAEKLMGVFALIGETEGDLLHCYRFLDSGDVEFLDARPGEYVLISRPVKGMRVIKYERREQAPDWHEPQ